MGVLVKLIRDMNQVLGITSVIVSHDVAETLTIADYVYLISQGRVVEHCTPAQLAASTSQWTRQFLDGLPDGPVPFHYPAADYASDLLGGGRS